LSEHSLRLRRPPCGEAGPSPWSQPNYSSRGYAATVRVADTCL